MLAYTDATALSDNPFQVRADVADRLVRAQAHLPDGYQLQIKEGWSPIWVQQHPWEASLAQLRATRPGLSSEQLEREPVTPPHVTARSDARRLSNRQGS